MQNLSEGYRLRSSVRPERVDAGWLAVRKSGGAFFEERRKAIAQDRSPFSEGLL